MPELVARIDALVRRDKGLESRYQVGDLILDTDSLEITRAGQPIKASKTVFEILKILMREHPRVVKRVEIERELWDEDPPDSDALRSHLYNLRQAVDRPFDKPMIETVTGQALMRYP